MVRVPYTYGKRGELMQRFGTLQEEIRNDRRKRKVRKLWKRKNESRRQRVRNSEVSLQRDLVVPPALVSRVKGGSGEA